MSKLTQTQLMQIEMERRTENHQIELKILNEKITELSRCKDEIIKVLDNLKNELDKDLKLLWIE